MTNSQSPSKSASSSVGRAFAGQACTLCLLVFVALATTGCATPPATYETPEAAVTALVDALQPLDTGKLRKVLGSEGDAIVSSGDPVEDRAGADEFVATYKASHRLVATPDGSMVLEMGGDAWSFPVPIVRTDKGWEFDSAAGREEILNRRIGDNELSTIQACLAFVDAQREYAMRDPDGDGLQEYAGKVLSDSGKRNGLYWPTADGERESPLGPLVAEAADEGYTVGSGASRGTRPFHGYRYHMLYKQGPNAAGGARDYIVNGKQIGGFACVASPAEYGNSGIMTFIVNQDGVVLERDLGPDTAREVRAMKAFNPGEGWSKVASVRDG